MRRTERDRLFDDRQTEYFNPVKKSIQIIRAVEQIEREKSELQDQIRELYDEAKDYGLNVAAIREVVKRRRKTSHERDELDSAVAEVEAVLGDGPDDGDEDGYDIL